MHSSSFYFFFVQSALVKLGTKILGFDLLDYDEDY